MKILIPIIKNTAALDFVLPLLPAIRKKYPAILISVLYLRESKSEILKGSKSYSKLMKEFNINEVDLSDIRKLHPTNFFGRWIDNDQKLMTRFLKQYSPTAILLDKTASSRRENAASLLKYIRKKKVKTYLLPHAPHHAKRISYVPFDAESRELPDFCEYWIPFSKEETWEAEPTKRNQFLFIGYPGMDSDWVDQIKKQPKNQTTSQYPFNIVFVIRRFMEDDQTSPPDAFVYSHREFSEILDNFSKSLKELNFRYRLIVKPHPSNKISSLESFFKQHDIKIDEISTEPIYEVMKKTDVIISLYSTVFLSPVVAGIPTVLLETSTQREVHKWSAMKELYEGLSYYIKDHTQIAKALSQIQSEVLKNESQPSWSKDIGHVRSFYPDHAIQRALDRLALNQLSSSK